MITNAFRFNYHKLFEVSINLFNFFEEIGYQNEFNKLKQNYRLINIYANLQSYIYEDIYNFELEKLEVKLMDMDKFELYNFLKFILNEHPFIFRRY